MKLVPNTMIKSFDLIMMRYIILLAILFSMSRVSQSQPTLTIKTAEELRKFHGDDLAEILVDSNNINVKLSDKGILKFQEISDGAIISMALCDRKDCQDSIVILALHESMAFRPNDPIYYYEDKKIVTKKEVIQIEIGHLNSEWWNSHNKLVESITSE